VVSRPVPVPVSLQAIDGLAMDTLIGILLLAMFGIVAWCVASEGAMGAVYSFFCVLFGGLLAMNFFEVVAPRLEKISRGFAPFADFVALVGLFWGFQPEARNFFDVAAPDRQWLGFNQWVSEHVLWNGRIFDGPQAEVEGTRQTVWPSFPIRYATRRASYASGNKPKSAPPPTPLTPPGGEVPSSGGSF